MRAPCGPLTPVDGRWRVQVAGLDFSHGVIIEGELRKKRANRMVKWRKKYYVLSKPYGAMFFWTGSRTSVEGVIKKVRFETFLSVRHLPSKQGGRRFDLRVVTGRTMELLAASREDAERWVSVIRANLGDVMAVIRVQVRFLRSRCAPIARCPRSHAAVDAVSRVRIVNPPARRRGARTRRRRR